MKKVGKLAGDAEPPDAEGSDPASEAELQAITSKHTSLDFIGALSGMGS